MPTKVILVHGKSTDPSQKWYPWLAREMAGLGMAFHAPKLPHADEPFMEEWEACLDRLHPDESTILIGHSRGGMAVLRWLEDQPPELTVKRVILVATNAGSLKSRVILSESNHGFYTKNGYNFTKIRQHCADFRVMHSKDDAWVPYTQGQENAAGLHAQLMTFENKGHFGMGVDGIPELLDLITA